MMPMDGYIDHIAGMQGGSGTEVREVVIPMPGGRNLTLTLPALDLPDLATILPTQLGERLGGLAAELEL